MLVAVSTKMECSNRAVGFVYATPRQSYIMSGQQTVRWRSRLKRFGVHKIVDKKYSEFVKRGARRGPRRNGEGSRGL